MPSPSSPRLRCRASPGGVLRSDVRRAVESTVILAGSAVGVRERWLAGAMLSFEEEESSYLAPFLVERAACLRSPCSTVPIGRVRVIAFLPMQVGMNPRRTRIGLVDLSQGGPAPSRPAHPTITPGAPGPRSAEVPASRVQRQSQSCSGTREENGFPDEGKRWTCTDRFIDTGVSMKSSRESEIMRESCQDVCYDVQTSERLNSLLELDNHQKR